jgi:hypothetical protein
MLDPDPGQMNTDPKHCFYFRYLSHPCRFPLSSHLASYLVRLVGASTRERRRRFFSASAFTVISSALLAPTSPSPSAITPLGYSRYMSQAVFCYLKSVLWNQNRNRRNCNCLPMRNWNRFRYGTGFEYISIIKWNTKSKKKKNGWPTF